MIDLNPQLFTILSFTLLFFLLFLGFPLGFVLAGVALAFGYLVMGVKVFPIFYSQACHFVMSYAMIALPMFLFMGAMVERSGLGKMVFDTLEIWLYRVKGHLAIVVVLTGTVLAACMGIIAASIVMMGMVALPHMMSRGYKKELATGAICAGGTLGILIPPSVMLVVYGPMAGISVGKLFMGAFGPGLTLSALYMIYIAVVSFIKPGWAPSGSVEAVKEIPWGRKIWLLFTSVVPIVGLVLAVLGSIFLGIASPTEASAVGAFVATLLALARRKLTWSVLKDVAKVTGRISGMVVIIAVGALCFMGVFMALGGGDVVQELLLSIGGGKWGVFALVMVIVFILGMFIDWMGIVFIVVPLVTPIATALGFHPLWFALMICVNLQMAFMTPPFCESIYFLRGTIPDKYGITMGHMVRGVIPFVILIWIGLGLCIRFPQIILWLPDKMIR